MTGATLPRAEREAKRVELIKACFDHFDSEATGSLPAARANALLTTVGISAEPNDEDTPLILAEFQQQVLHSSTLKQAPPHAAARITTSPCAGP